MSSSAPIGIFDSGIGGFSVLQAVRRQLPAEAVEYVADQAHVPYGPRPADELRGLADGITRFLLERGCKLVVVACNTASGVALHELRRRHPQVPFVGMEPAVKPAAAATRSGVVGVLATPATLRGELYAGVVQRFAHGKTILEDACPGLVERIEAGDTAGPDTRAILERALRPMLARGMDALVLGCTHYPFVLALIRDITGPDVRVFDPAPAIARRVASVLEDRGLLAPASAAGGAGEGALAFFTTGAAAPFAAQIRALLAPVSGATPVPHTACWSAPGRLAAE